MAGGKGNKSHTHDSPRINNRRATHEYHIEAKIECGMVLVGTEVKSLRAGTAQLQEAYATIEHGKLILHGAHIDPYKQSAIVYNHLPTRDRILLAHKREISKLEDALKQRGTTLIPLAIYFKEGRAKVEIGVARGKQQFDKRATIKKREMENDLRRVMSRHRK